MKQEDKELLFIDLCGRIPYKVRMFEIEPVNNIQSNLTLLSVTNKASVICITPREGVIGSSIDAFKPYLFPLSSMTEEQFLELTELCNMYDNYNDYNPHEYWGIQVCRKHIHGNKPCFCNNYKVIDWFNKNHFDYRGLIEKGLAIDATGLNIY